MCSMTAFIILENVSWDCSILVEHQWCGYPKVSLRNKECISGVIEHILSILKAVLDNLLETYAKSLISSLFCVHLLKAENRWNFFKFKKLVQKWITKHLNHLIWHGCNVMIRNYFYAKVTWSTKSSKLHKIREKEHFKGFHWAFDLCVNIISDHNIASMSN